MAINHERPVSPLDGIHFKDDFISNDSVADAAVGTGRWEIVTIGNASTYSLLTAQVGGVLRSTTAGTADGDGSALRSFEDGLVLEGGNGGFAFRARYPAAAGNQLAGNNFRIGLDDSVTATSPTVGIWVDSDAGVISLQVDSADHGDTAASAAGVTTLTSGTTMVLDKWHLFRVEWTGTNGQGGPRFVELFVDNEPAGSAFCNIDNDEEVELKIAHWQDTGGAATLEFDTDFFEFWSFYNRDTATAV